MDNIEGKVSHDNVGYKYDSIYDPEHFNKLVLTPKILTPFDKQVGGSHYKDMAIEPSVFIVRNKLGWYEGNAVKYICRHKAKGGRQDLEKAIHYLELALEELYPTKLTIVGY